MGSSYLGTTISVQRRLLRGTKESENDPELTAAILLIMGLLGMLLATWPPGLLRGCIGVIKGYIGVYMDIYIYIEGHVAFRGSTKNSTLVSFCPPWSRSSQLLLS